MKIGGGKEETEMCGRVSFSRSREFLPDDSEANMPYLQPMFSRAATSRKESDNVSTNSLGSSARNEPK